MCAKEYVRLESDRPRTSPSADLWGLCGGTNGPLEERGMGKLTAKGLRAECCELFPDPRFIKILIVEPGITEE